MNAAIVAVRPAEESKEQQSIEAQSDKTFEASQLPQTGIQEQQFSHLFPAHLYVKKRSAG